MSKVIKSNFGYTLIEIVIVLVIMSILISFAIGPLRGTLLRNKVSNQTSLLQLDLSLARSEAINRAYSTLVIPKESWNKGWDIVVDTNNNGTFDDEEELIRSTKYSEKTIQLLDSEDNTQIEFTSFGNLKSAIERNFIISHQELPKSKMIVIAAAGSISVRSIENESE